MFSVTEIVLTNIVLHKVGNKLRDEGVKLSKMPLQIKDDIKQLLLHYFLNPFKENEFFNFYHDIDINMNEVFVCAKDVFENPDRLYEQSLNIAKHLYEQSTHPKVKSGELYVTYLRDCFVNGVLTDGIGLFKSETKETYLRVFPTSDTFEISSDNGININKLDKGCLIFNVEKENGYLVATVDTLNKGTEAKYWADLFLHIKPRKDEYFYTENIISLCKNFTSNSPNLGLTQKADILNKAVSFFKENESFDMDDFSNQIMKEESMKEAFQQYRSQYEQDRDIIIVDDFNISQQALKKQVRTIKNIIKLDNNFKISIDGDTRYLEKGYDEEKRMNFYKLYFRDEE